MRREVAIALRARITWVGAAVAALLTGHGFVLAVDLYSAASRSALASALQAREMDPLAGVVRPTLGGTHLALALLGPLVAARVLSAEKERGTFGALCLAEGGTTVVILRKLGAACIACALLVAPALACLVLFAIAGGHVDGPECAIALGGALFHAAVVAGVSIAAAAWTKSTAQAAALGILLSISAWAIDAADGFAALAWLGGAASWSIDRQLAPLERGIVAIGSMLWLTVVFVGAAGLAAIGARFGLRGLRRFAALGCTLAALAAALSLPTSVRRGYDWSESRRASFPPAAVDGLRDLETRIRLEVWLDRDDSRRRQLESDVLAKLILARPDTEIAMPLDRRDDLRALERDADYGRIVLRVGGVTRETRSTSRRELVTLIFEAAGRPLPTWTQPPYPGFPMVIAGARRAFVVSFAYAVVPLLFGAIGFALTRRRITR